MTSKKPFRNLSAILLALSSGTLCAGAARAQTPADPSAASLPAPARLGGAPDYAYAAYQSGHYVAAMQEAMARIKADPEDGPAMTLIGELYAKGLGVKRDPAEAARWYGLAAARSDPQGMLALGLAKLKGEGVAQDRAAAQSLFEKAAAQGLPGAIYNLGVIAVETNGKNPDFEKAAGLFRQAAELGLADAAFALGLLYKNGTGVEKNDEQAASWIGRAAKEGHVPAEVEYAIMLFNGTGTAKDEAAAANLFLRAAVQNNPVAQNRLARILAAGRGLPKDRVEAMKWHLLAKAAGVKDSWLDGELAKLSPQEKAAVEARVHQDGGLFGNCGRSSCPCRSHAHLSGQFCETAKGNALAHVLRQRRLYLHRRPAFIKRNHDGFGVKVQPRSTPAIDAVAQDGPAKRRAMNAQLMRAPGERRELKKGKARPAPAHPPAGLRRGARRIGFHPPAAAGIEAFERQINQALNLCRAAFDNRPIDLLHLALLEEEAKLF